MKSAVAYRHEQEAHESGHVPVCGGACEPHLPSPEPARRQHAAGGPGRQRPPEPGSPGSLHLRHGSLPGARMGLTYPILNPGLATMKPAAVVADEILSLSVTLCPSDQQ